MVSVVDDSGHERDTRGRPVSALIALLVLLPVPSLGTWIGLWLLPGEPLGKVIFFAAKVWLVLVPVAWRLGIERRGLSLSPPRHGGLFVGAILGVALSCVIVLAYLTLGKMLLDPETFSRMGAEVGLSDWRVYLAGAAYWIAVNSVLEEMVWRWFVVERFEDLGMGMWSIWASALGFTVHHIVALALYCSWPATWLCCAGIFVGGALWSALYRRYRSIWPGYISHAIVDVAVFAIGWFLIVE